jgi:uncharacterized iron-regulated membrane protein
MKVLKVLGRLLLWIVGLHIGLAIMVAAVLGACVLLDKTVDYVAGPNSRAQTVHDPDY